MKLEKPRRLTTLSILACLLLFLLISCSPNDDEVVVIEEGSATTTDETPTTTDTTPPTTTDTTPPTTTDTTPPTTTDTTPSTTTDTTPPTAVSVSIDGGAVSTSSTSVTLTLSATDDVAVTHYYASESASTPAASAAGWSSYATSASFTLSSASGAGTHSRTVYVWFKDAAGNLSGSVNDAINFIVNDTTAPTANSVVIDSGASTTTSASVTLTLNATDDVAVTHYYASESSNAPAANASGWASYTTSVSYTFDTTTNETKTIYVWFKDAAGNLSSSATDSISFSNHWPVQFGTSGLDDAEGVSVDNAGNAYVVGYTWGTLDGQSSAGDRDAFLVKYDSAGNQLWLRQLGTSGLDVAWGVSVDSAGDVYVAGYTEGTFDGQSSGGNAFLVKYDSEGNQLWLRQLGTSSTDAAKGVSVDGAGNVYVAGLTQGTFDDQSNAGGQDAFLVKYDSEGNQQWLRQLGTSGGDEAWSVSVDSAGDVYVAGDTWGTFADQSSAGSSDTFLVKYDSEGNQLWLRQLGTFEGDGARGVSVDSAGNAYVAGYTTGTFTDQSSAGSRDTFLVKYDRAGIQQWLQQFGTSEFDDAYGVSVDGAGNVYVAGYTRGTFDGQDSAGDDDAFLVKYDSAGIQQWLRQLGTSEADVAEDVSVDSAGNVYVAGLTVGAFDGQSSAGDEDAFVVKYDSAGTQQ